MKSSGPGYDSEYEKEQLMKTVSIHFEACSILFGALFCTIRAENNKSVKNVI